MWRHYSLVIASALVGGPSLANVVGNDHQNFNPVMGGSDFVTVQSSKLLLPGQFHIGLFINEAINSLPYAKTDKQSRSKVSDSITSANGFIGVGILPRLELAIGAPFVVDQNVKNDDTRGEFAERGNTDIMSALKFSLLKKNGFGLALVAGATFNRTQDNPSLGESQSPIYSTELAADFSRGRMIYGLNIGYRWREAGDKIDGSLVDPTPNQSLASVALGYKMTTRASLVGEVYSSQPLSSSRNDSDRSSSSAESLVGVRYALNNLILTHFGAGSELAHGYSTPDWRLYAGIVTTFGAADAQKSARISKKKNKPRRPKPAPRNKSVDLPVDDDYQQPALASLPQQEPDEVFVLHNINFEFDSDFRVLPGAVAELQKLVNYLEKTSYNKLIVEGHTDYFGTDEYNMDLSFRRARTVRRYLIKYLEMQPSIIDAVGHGESMPMTTDTSDHGRQLNRRVEIKIYKNDALAH